MADTETGRQSNGRFGPGNSFGRVAASRSHRARLAKRFSECVTEEDVEAVATEVITMATNGDLDAARLLFDRSIGKVQPPAETETIDLGSLDSLTDCAEATKAIARAQAAGEINSVFAEAMSKRVDAIIAALAASDVEERLTALEERNELTD